ncbi:MAG: DUF1232 domain-containing protein [Saprospiraceae bacterium]|nr:DUF1232 domain-containing protein [Bacteroidia bacterium]NNL92256.1 DUF1232 domain-containing protein [Saprospiraceae bacterium]
MNKLPFIKIDKLTSYILEYIKQLSVKGFYVILLLYYAYHNSNTPSWAKRIIIGSLAYFISPIDSIPDLTPLIGMTDDMGVLSFGLVTIACYINEDVRMKSIDKLHSTMGYNVNPDLIEEVNNWL